jgi:carbamoyl-phosphate synthase large subunit
MQHVEQAGVHSGDSACSLPPYSLARQTVEELKRQTAALARGLKVVGLMNVQFAVQRLGGRDVIFVLEVNPRASRTVPFVSKATGLPLAKIAARCMVGQSLVGQGVTTEVVPPYYSVKECVFPFVKFPGVDTILGPEMKSTGEVMGTGSTFGEAFAKSQLAAGVSLPRLGRVLITVKDSDKTRAVRLAQRLLALGFSLSATQGTAARISAAGLAVTTVPRVSERGPTVVDAIANREISLLIITVDEKRSAIADSRTIRLAALAARTPFYTTIAGAEAVVEALCHMDSQEVHSLQGLHHTVQVTREIADHDRSAARGVSGPVQWQEPAPAPVGLWGWAKGPTARV